MFGKTPNTKLVLTMGCLLGVLSCAIETNVEQQPTTVTSPSGWNAIAPGGQTLCSDGSEYRFFVRRGSMNRLTVYLQGGGACWMRRNCDPEMSPTYNINLEGFDPSRYRGIFDESERANPFTGDTIVFAPYCSGDVHLGASDTVYPADRPDQSPLTIYHRGFANMQSVLDWTYTNLKNPKQVFVTGSSAGAIPSPYYAMKIADHYPAARVTQLGDGGGGYRRSANTRLPHRQWGTVAVLRNEDGFEDLTDATFSYGDLYVRAARRRPDVLFSSYDAAEDAVQKRFLALAGNSDESLMTNLEANQADIRARVDNFRSYIAGGDSHTILGRPEFFTYTVAERSVRDWIADVKSSRPVDDVWCTDCALPEFAGYPTPGALRDLWLQWEDPAIQNVEPFKIFDNLYYVGIDWVSAYVLVTTEGLILIDALYGKWARELPGKLTRLGFDPNDVKYVLVTHGHFDHAGGARLFQRRYGANIVMMEADWHLAEAPPSHPLFAMAPPKRDIVARDGQVIRLGNSRVELLHTPGHTPGVMTLRYDVLDGNRTYRAITLGGVGLNFTGVAQTEAYIASYERLQAMPEVISVSLPNHAVMANLFHRRDQPPQNDTHPFADPAAYRESLALFLANARDKLAAEKAGNARDPLTELTRALHRDTHTQR